MRASDLAELSKVLQPSFQPIVDKLQRMEDRMRDQATRSDLDALRKEIVNTFVPKDALEPRLSSITADVNRLEKEITVMDATRETLAAKADINALQAQMQNIHDRLESGKQQIEERFTKQAEAQLSATDRTWVRWGQITGWVALLISVLSFIFQHLHFS